jgi:hypothetical protein
MKQMSSGIREAAEIAASLSWAFAERGLSPDESKTIAAALVSPRRARRQPSLRRPFECRSDPAESSPTSRATAPGTRFDFALGLSG